MKGHKAHHHGRKHHAAGGEAHGDAAKGHDEFKEDMSHNPQARDNAHEIEGEAEARKHGGRAKRKHGGHVTHMAHPLKHVAKHLGKVQGHAGAHHAGRKPRKAGGRTGSNDSPLSSAHAGHLPPHHKDARID